MRTGPRIAAWIGGIVLAVLAAGALATFAFFREFYPAPPPFEDPPATDVATAQRQDLDYFRNYFRLDRAYTPTALAQADALWREARSAAGTLTPGQFALAILRMVALSDNGHSQVLMPSLYASTNRIPCRLNRFDDGYYFVRAGGNCASLLGARLVAIDGRPVEQVLDRMYAYSLGPRNHFDQYVAPFVLESPDVLHAAGLAAAPGALRLRVRDHGGGGREVGIGADPPNAAGATLDSDWTNAYPDAYLSPRWLVGEPLDWSALLPRDGQLPLFLDDYANPFHIQGWPDRGVLYVQFRSNQDEPGYPIKPFVADVERALASGRPRCLVLDLRLDRGGHFTTTAALMKRIARASPSIEHVYVLTSAWTFSAGNASLALVRQHGGGKVTTIGAAPGDRVRFWAEGRGMELPNSRLRMHYATAYEDYAKPCWGHRGCFWTLLLFPTHVASFDPDVPVPYTFDDYLRGRDPLLETALQLARARGR